MAFVYEKPLFFHGFEGPRYQESVGRPIGTMRRPASSNQRERWKTPKKKTTPLGVKDYNGHT